MIQPSRRPRTVYERKGPGEKLDEGLGQFLRRARGHAVPRVDTPTTNIRGPAPPDRDLVAELVLQVVAQRRCGERRGHALMARIS